MYLAAMLNLADLSKPDRREKIQATEKKKHFQATGACIYTINTQAVTKSQQLIRIEEIMLFDMHELQQVDMDVVQLFLCLQT